MICEHGNEITVILDLRSDVCWGDGIYQYNEDGQYVAFGKWYLAHPGSSCQDYYDEHAFVQVLGCPDCQTVRVMT